MNHSKRNHFRPYALALACGLTLSSIAFAANQAAPKSTEAQFKAMDTDGDGRLSPAEHAAGAKKMFDMMDANKDGKVTAAEMDAAKKLMPGKRMPEDKNMPLSSKEKIKVVDTNGDGILTAAEHASGSKTMFDRMDADKNGFLNRLELAAGHARMLHKQANSNSR